MVDEKEEDKEESNKSRSGITFTVQGKDGINVEKEKNFKEEDVWIEVIDEDKKGEIDIENSFKREEEIKSDGKDVRIELINVSKKFDRNFQKNQTALARLLSFFKWNNKQNFWALENISLKVNKGENLGIIGKNGSGKSTLLRVIAEVYKIEEGKVKTKGQLVYLTGFGHGLQPRLTMRENIFLVGSIMGLGQPDIKKRFNEIVEFAGLKDYVNTKLFKFSTGMQTRLASSIGLHCVAHKKPDILLVDEVIGGGADKEYQEKSLKKMEELLKGGSTVVLVSHNLDAIKKYCDRVIWLEDGRVKMEGKPEEVVREYEMDTGFDSVTKRIILFRFYSNLEVCKNRLELIKKLNPNIDIYGLYSGDEEKIDMFKNSLSEYLKDFFAIKGNTSNWNWKNCDLNIREWYKRVGINIDFDVVHVIDWDLLIFEPLNKIYKNFPVDSVGLTNLRIINKDSKWMWVSEEPHKSEYKKLLKSVKENYGYDKKPLSCLGPGACYPKDFLKKYSETEIPDLCHEEIRIPLYSQIFGFEIYDNGFVDINESNSKFVHCSGQVDIKTIIDELNKERGQRVFHPYWEMFDLSFMLSIKESDNRS